MRKRKSYKSFDLNIEEFAANSLFILARDIFQFSLLILAEVYRQH